MFAVVLVALDFYSSFLLQARGALHPDGNATLVGRFETIPSIAQVCPPVYNITKLFFLINMPF